MDTTDFVQRIVAAAAEGGVTAVREEVERSVSDLAALHRVIPEPTLPVIEPLYVSADLTVMHTVWGPRMYIGPHDHRMWACLGVYGGREDNQLYRRQDESIVSAGGHSVETGQTILLGEAAVHSVHNPLDRLTGAIHVYGGAFLTEPRSEWDIETLTEQPSSAEGSRRLFEEQARAMSAEA